MMSAPIFIFGVGGRTGSTWVARALTSTGGVLIWPETRLLQAALSHSRLVAWGSNLDEFRADRTVRYCLRPSRGAFLAGLRAFAETTLGESARREDFPRWGTKELYWRVDDLQAVAELWPEAKIVLLTRRFRDTFASAIGLPQFETAACKLEFVRSWLGIAREASYARRAGLPLITARYEDLAADGCRGLARECGLPEPPPLEVFGSSRRELTPVDEDLLKPFADEIAALEADLAG